MYYHPRKPRPNEDRIFKQRQYEAALQDRVNSVHQYENLIFRAEFEQLNEPKSCHRSLTEKLEAIRAHREQVLRQRRMNLMQLFEEEDNGFNHEIKTSSMNLQERRAWLQAQARNANTQGVGRNEKHSETQLERALNESCDEVRRHNSKLAVMRAEEEIKRQREEMIQKRKEIEKENLLHCQHSEFASKCHKEEPIDILRDQLAMVQRLREEERAAIEEDMRNMTRRWHNEEEVLKQKQYQQRCLDSQKAEDLLLYNEQNGANKIEGLQEETKHDAHMIAMVADRATEEEHQEQQLKESHREEAKAYADQLKLAFERQKREDEELEAMINAEVDCMWHKQGSESQHLHDTHGGHHSEYMSTENSLKHQDEGKRFPLGRCQTDGEILDQKKLSQEDKMSKKEIMDALEAQLRLKQAAELVQEEMKRAECEGTKVAEKSHEIKLKQTLADLPYPEPWYGRKAVKWYD